MEYFRFPYITALALIFIEYTSKFYRVCRTKICYLLLYKGSADKSVLDIVFIRGPNTS